MNKLKLAELIGIIIGDGNIYYNKKFRKYYFEITGDPLLENEYFRYISDLVFSLLGKRPGIRVGGRGLKLRCYSKDFVEFLINDLGMPYGNKKGLNITIPSFIYDQEWNILKYCIRGIIDTDGSLFLAKKSHRIDYPTIEVSTISKNLAYQLKFLLSGNYRIGFRYFSKKGITGKYVISINGEEMVDRYINDIGFSNLRKLKVWDGRDLNPRHHELQSCLRLNKIPLPKALPGLAK